MNRILAALGLLLMSVSIVLAQGSTGTILGVVRDSSGGAVPDARVTVTNASTTNSRTANSGSDGSYRFDALTPGPYTVAVAKEGFQTSSVTSLTLEVTQQLVANVTLQVGSVSQQVTVQAEAAQVNTTQSALGGLVTTDQVAELPLNGRNFIDLALLQPGVANASGNSPASLNPTWFSTNGAPIRANLATLDGAPMINLMGTTANAVGTTLGVDGIQEFRVITNSFGAQYGIGMGSQIVMVSKGGANKFHGDLFDYLRNDVMDAKGYFAASVPKLVRNNFGGSFGGPIKKDNTFFYAVYEGLRQRQGVTTTINTLPANCHVLTGNPCATNTTGTYINGNVNPAIAPFLELYPLPNVGTSKYTTNPVSPETVDYGQIRVDHTFSASDSIFARVTIDKSILDQPVSFAGTPYQNVGKESIGSEMFNTVSWTHIFSPTLLNTFRFSYGRNLDTRNPLYPAIFNDPKYRTVYNQPLGSWTVTSLGGGLGAPGTAPQGFSQNLYTLSDDIYLTKGRHAIQFGILFNRFEYYAFDSESIRGNLTFSNTANLMAGTYSIFSDQAPGSNIYRAPRFYTFGFYVQDDWRVSSRLTLNLGLRYEPATVPWDRLGANWSFRNLTDPGPTQGPIFRNATLHNFGPRIGFAWDIRGNGKTAVRAAFGEYGDVDSAGQSFYGTSAGTPPLSSMITLANTTITSLPLITAADNLVPGAIPYGQSMKSTNYAVSQPRMYQWNLSVERQITPSMTIAVAYVGSRGVHLWDNEEGNPCLPQSITNGIPNWGTDTGKSTVTLNGVSTSVSHICNSFPGGVATIATYPNGKQYVVPTSRNPLWGDWLLSTTNGDSNYHAGELTLTKRTSHGLEGQFAYTFGKVMDSSQGQFSISECQGSGGIPSQSLQPLRKIFNYGPACFDIQQTIQASLVYHFPNTTRAGVIGREVLSGWWIGNRTNWQTGFSFSPTSSNWRSLDQNLVQNSGHDSEYINYGVATVAPNATGVDGTRNSTGDVNPAAGVTFIPYNPKTVIVGKPSEWFNPLMFTLNPIGQLGTVHKAVLRGPHFADVDLSLSKDTKAHFLGESGEVEFRAEVFNLFNQTNFALPAYHSYTGTLTDVGMYTEAPNSTAGTITALVGNPRQIQLSLKVLF